MNNNRRRPMSQEEMMRGELGAGNGAQPKRLNAWSASGTLTTTPFTNATPVRGFKEVGLQASFDEAGPFTLQFGVVAVDPNLAALIPVGAVALATFAEITWNVEGNPITRVVSIGNGTTISGSGQGVQVKIYDLSNVSAFATGFDYFVSVNVTPGTRPTNNTPPIFVWPPGNSSPKASGFIIGAPVTTVDVAIPPNIGVISANVSLAGSGIIIPDQAITVQQIPSSAFGATILAEYDPRAIEWAPIAPGATFLRIKNWVQAGGANGFVTFGIDG